MGTQGPGAESPHSLSHPLLGQRPPLVPIVVTLNVNQTSELSSLGIWVLILFSCPKKALWTPPKSSQDHSRNPLGNSPSVGSARGPVPPPGEGGFPDADAPLCSPCSCAHIPGPVDHPRRGEGRAGQGREGAAWPRDGAFSEAAPGSGRGVRGRSARSRMTMPHMCVGPGTFPRAFKCIILLAHLRQGLRSRLENK